jgi:hypothetical protein
MTVQIVYGLFYNDEFDDPWCVYVGTTARTAEERFAEHIKGIRDLSTTKDLYHYARKRKLVDRLYIEVLETKDTEDGAETETWEAFWVKEMIKLGHPLQNSKMGNLTPTQVQDKLEAEFKVINKRASVTVAKFFEYEKGEGFTEVAKVKPAENQLTKAETLRQRVTDAVPSLADFEIMAWCEREKNRWAVAWGKYFISLKKTGAGWKINIFDEDKRLDLGTDMVTNRREAVFEWCIKNWLNPTCWNPRKA